MDESQAQPHIWMQSKKKSWESFSSPVHPLVMARHERMWCILLSVATEKGILRKDRISQGWWHRFLERQEQLTLRHGDNTAHVRMDASVRNKDVKVVGQMSEHFEFGSDIFNLGRTLFVWISMYHTYNVKSLLKFTPPFQVPCSMWYGCLLIISHLLRGLASYFYIALCHNHPRDSALPGKNCENHK